MTYMLPVRCHIKYIIYNKSVVISVMEEKKVGTATKMGWGLLQTRVTSDSGHEQISE